jgi:adenosylcobinamide-GDP ribazoletransferase
MHLDGLSDWGDSLGAIHDRKRMLEIMKDSRVGTFGLLTCFVIMLGKWTAYKQLFEFNSGEWIIMSYIVSRAMQVEMAVTLPYARAEGGTARGFVADAKTHHRIVVLLLTFMISVFFFRIIGLLGLMAGWIICFIFRWWCKRRVGGVTGDLIGACSEMVELTVLMTGCLIHGIPGF